MSILGQIKNELSQLGIKPKKSLGQNFLINEGVHRKIVAALEIKPTDTILEIGPGLGTLTEYLAQTGARIIAIEKDRRLVEHLRQKFQNNPKVEIIEGDILKLVPGVQGSGFSEELESKTGRPEAELSVRDGTGWTLDAERYKVVGNIPYYLTSHLLRTIFENWPQPESIVLMLQKEVAQRIVAKPPKMSLLGVSVQYYAEPKIISYVSRNSFWPSPEVDSALVKLEPRPQTDAELHADLRRKKGEVEKFFKVVRAGFAGKRKQLANNLARGLGMPKQVIEEKLQSVGVDPKRRAETLTLAEWQKLTEIL